MVVNSTVGLSALHHGVPTKVCGEALYDQTGLTYGSSLDQFWCAAPQAVPQRALYWRFREHLLRHTQLNGNFYKRISASSYKSGLIWREGSAAAKLVEDFPVIESAEESVTLSPM